MSVKRGDVGYVLLNEENSTFETFETEEDLLDFVRDEDFDVDEVSDLRVIAVSQEYKIDTRPYELVEV